MITFDCSSCKQSIEVENEHARQEVECPYCETVVVAPAATKVKAISKPAETAVKLRGDDDDRPVKKKKRSRSGEPDERWGPKDKYYDDDDDRPRTNTMAANRNMIGGIIGMVIAVVWFFGFFLFLNRILFYPPILFILSLIAFIKGMMGESD